MRLRMGWMVMTGIVLGGILLSPLVRTMPATAKTTTRLPENLRAQALRSPAFVLPTHQWLEFDLAEGPNRVRVLTNANLSNSIDRISDAEVATREWGYRIRYELLDAGNVLVDSGDYHFRTRLDRYRDPASGRQFPARFYDGIDSVLAATRETNFSHSSDRPLRWLRIRLESSDPDVEEVITRVYCLNDRPDSHLDKTWQELSMVRRELLAAGCVYPHDLLCREERRNLLRSVWSPLAPVGFEGHSYTQRPLCLLRGVEAFRVQDIPSPTGFLVYDQFRALLPVPMGSGRVRLQFQTFSTTERANPPRTVELRWYGHRVHERRAVTIQFPSETANDSDSGTTSAASTKGYAQSAILASSAGSNRWTCEFDTKDGLYELRSETPLVIYANWQPSAMLAEAGTTEITPPPTYLRTYATMVDQPVNFKVSHLEDSPTTVRVSVRAAAGHARRIAAAWTDSGGRQKVDMNSLFIAGSGELPAFVQVALEWRCLDAGGHVVRSGTCTGKSAWSVYDRLADDVLTTQVSDPLDFWFSIPHNVVRLELVTNGAPLLVAAATRPSDIAKVTAVPEDYSRFAGRDTDNRSWFAMRAIGHEDLNLFGMSPLLVTQTRPPEDDEDRAAGRYTWEEFPPNDDWRGRYVLTPRDPEQPTSEDSVPALFYELTRNVTSVSGISADLGRRTVSPTLVYRFHDPSPSPLRVFVRGRLHQEVIPESISSEVILLPILADDVEQQIRVECDVPVQLWMNRIELPDALPWLKRLAVEFDRPVMEFVYHKQSGNKEQASLSVFRSQAAAGRLDVRVSIRPYTTKSGTGTDNTSTSSLLAPSDDFTLSDRIFSLAPSDAAPTQMLPAGRDLLFDGGRACLIPFGSDLPQGDYIIRIERESSADLEVSSDPVYFILSRTTSGTAELRDISIETWSGAEL